MNEATTTWALVVGIYEYDLPALRRLTGAAADAAAAVGWLRSLGVPDAQILLHAAPSLANAKLLADLALPYKPARQPDIWSSVSVLRKVTGGTRLFVFLSGHGLYEPAKKRLFLTQEAGVDDAWKNLGLDAYLDLFRSFGFARQFLFMDGCQNYPYPETARGTIDAELYGGPGATPRPETTVVACYAAAQDQRALEVDGRGLFLRHVLDGLRPDDPCADAVDLDFATGARTIDLRKLLYWCKEAVEREARQQSPPLDQSPQLDVRGKGQSDAVSPVVRLPDVPTAAVRVEVSPPAAQADLKRLRISVDEPPQWDLRLPRFASDPILLPLASRLPIGAQGTAQCNLRPEAPWDLANGQQTFTVMGDQVLVFEMALRTAAPGHKEGFAIEPARVDRGSGARGGEIELERAAPPEVFRLRTRGQDGALVYNAFRYDEVARAAGFEVDARTGEVADGVSIEHHEHGPDFRVRRDALRRGRQVAEAWARAVEAATPPGVTVSLAVSAEAEAEPNLRLVLPAGGAPALAGALAGRQTVWIGPPAEPPAKPVWRGVPGGLSLAEVAAAAARRVEPGPVRVLVDLPWGNWSRVVRAPASGEVAVELPASVGEPPLRVALAEALGWQGTAVLGVQGEAPAGRERAGLYGSEAAPLANAAVPGAAWALVPGEDVPHTGWLAELADGRAAFPLLHGRALALDLSRGGLRIEPLSAVPTPAWDLLLAMGRLDVLTPEDTVELTARKWDDWILGLAGAYAIYSSPESGRHLDVVLGNLDRLTAERVPDLDLLRIALANRSGRQEEPAPLLTPWAEAGAVPILRWGVPLALQLLSPLADREPFARWRKALAGVERSLSPISTWTAWTPVAAAE